MLRKIRMTRVRLEERKIDSVQIIQESRVAKSIDLMQALLSSIEEWSMTLRTGVEPL